MQGSRLFTDVDLSNMYIERQIEAHLQLACPQEVKLVMVIPLSYASNLAIRGRRGSLLSGRMSIREKDLKLSTRK